MMHRRIEVEGTASHKFKRLLEFLLRNGISFPITSKHRSWVCALKLWRMSHHFCTLQSLKYWKTATGLLPHGQGSCFFTIINTPHTCSSCGAVSSPPNNLFNLLWPIFRYRAYILTLCQCFSWNARNKQRQITRSLSGHHAPISSA